MTKQLDIGTFKKTIQVDYQYDVGRLRYLSQNFYE